MVERADTTAPAVAVVIPAWNAAATIEAQLAALAGQRYTGRFRVVVVDDGSTDETVAVVERLATTLPMEVSVLSQPNGGASAARNTGVLATEEPLLLFCDADDLVAEDWVNALASALSSADAVGGRIELGRLNTPNQIGWAIGTEGLTRSWNQPHEWGMPSPLTSCSGVTREAFMAVGGFNEQLRRGEDTDFFWRMQCQGRSLAEAPQAIIHYRLASSPRIQLSKLFRDGQANTVLLWAFRHPKRRRQLFIEVAGAIRRSPNIIWPARRVHAIYNLVWVAGRASGVAQWKRRRQTGPLVRPLHQLQGDVHDRIR